MLLSVSIVETKNISSINTPLIIQTHTYSYQTITDLTYREGFIIPFNPLSLPLTISLPASSSSATFSDLDISEQSVLDRWIALFASDGARIDVHLQISVTTPLLQDSSSPFDASLASPALIHAAMTSPLPGESEITATAIVSLVNAKQLSPNFARLVREFTQRVRTKPLAALVFPLAPWHVLLRAFLRLHAGPQLAQVLGPIFAEMRNEESPVLLIGRTITGLMDIVNKYVPSDFVKILQDALQRSHAGVDSVMTAAYMLSLAVLQTAVAYADTLGMGGPVGVQVAMLQMVAGFFEPAETEVGRVAQNHGLQGEFKAGIRKLFGSGTGHRSNSAMHLGPAVTPGQMAQAVKILKKYMDGGRVESESDEEVNTPEFVKLVGGFVKTVTAKSGDTQHYFHHYHLHQAHNSVHHNSSSVAIYTNRK